MLVPRKPKSPPRQKPSSRAVSPIGRRESDLKDGRDRGYRGRDAPRDDYRNRRPSPLRRRSPPMRDVRDSRYDRQRRPLSPPRSRRYFVCSQLGLPVCLTVSNIYVRYTIRLQESCRLAWSCGGTCYCTLRSQASIQQVNLQSYHRGTCYHDSA